MYKYFILSSFLLMVISTGCNSTKNDQSLNIISVDVKSNYPERTFMLQDIMDVEYIPLETTDEFITKGVIETVGNDIILARNWGNNGDIFLFDRHTGKGLKKINRFGQGAEEYSQITSLILDEINKEIFVKDNPARKIIVYDYSGNFKRAFGFKDTGFYVEISDYDKDQLLCFMGYLPEVENPSSTHLLISKTNGEITKEITLPYGELETPVIIEGEASITPGFCQTVPFDNDWVLMRTSSDTIYRYSREKGTEPLLVRYPSVHKMDKKVFLFPYLFTSRYYFMQAMEKSVDFKTMKGFPTTDLVYDVQDKAIYTYKMYNQDFSDDRQLSLSIKPNTVSNSNVATFQVLQTNNLLTALNKDKLRSPLKDIALKLDEEANPVVMLIKYKQ